MCRRFAIRYTPLCLVLLGSLAFGGCRRDDGQSAGTTTIRSGTPEGVRVTNAEADGAFDAPARLAGAVCSHERDCANRRGQLDTEALRQREAACVDEIRPTAELSLQALGCSPAVARAGYEECLAALRSDGCAATAGYPEILPACRPSAICRRGLGLER
jgi:hypothetical protein